jgi:biotin--protein ligase
MSNRFIGMNLDRNSNGSEYANLVNELIKDEPIRSDFMRACLVKLGLKVNDKRVTVPALSELYLSGLYSADIAALYETLESITDIEKGQRCIKAEMDTFILKKLSSDLQELESSLNSATISALQISKNDTLNDTKSTTHVFVCDSTLPPIKRTPKFQHESYFSSLEQYQQQSDTAENFGKVLLYGEVVTSTNTMLEK